MEKLAQVICQKHSLCLNLLYYVLWCITYHGFSKPGADFGEYLRIVEVGHCLHHGPCPLLRLAALEYPRPHKHSVYPKLHQETHVCRCRWNQAGRERGELMHIGQQT